MEKSVSTHQLAMIQISHIHFHKLVGFLFLLCTTFISNAQNPSSDTVQIPRESVISCTIPPMPRIIDYQPIELVAGRFFANYRYRMQSIDRINSKDLNLLPARSVSDALSYAAGVDVRQRGISGTQADIGIRGGNFEQSLIVVNGFKMTDPQTGHHAANLPVPLIAVSDIQVFKSPTVLQFGQSALTGAVHLGAYNNELFQIKAQTYGGSFNSFGGQALLKNKIKKYQQLLALAHDQSAGHWENSDFQNYQLFYTSAHPLGESEKNRLSYLGAFTSRDFGANGFYSNKFPEQWEKTQMAMVGIKHNYNTTSKKYDPVYNWLRIQQQVMYRSHADEFRLKRFDPSFYTNTHQSTVLSYEFNITLGLGVHELVWGAEQRFEQLLSSNLGQRERQYQSTFVQAKGKLDGFQYAAGLLLFSYDWANPQMMPSIQLGKELTYSQFVFLNYSRGNRVPSWTEMYYTDPSNVGNPNLLPEFSHAAEVGYRFLPTVYNSKRYFLNASAALFYRQHTNMIDWVRDASAISPNPNPWMPVNIASVAFSGLETQFQYTLKKSSQWGLNNLKVNYTYINARHNFTSEQESRYAITSLRHQLNGQILIDLGSKIKLNITERLVQRIEQELYQVLDLKLIVPINNVNAFAEVNNLTNTQYVEAGFVQMPGRWFKLGLTFDLKKDTGLIVYP